MANGYDLAYERLAALPESREIEEVALDALRTARVAGCRFRLSISVDEPPEVFAEWDVSDPGRRIDVWARTSHLSLWGALQVRTMDRGMWRGVAERHYGMDGGVRRVHPCKRAVVLDGRRAPHGGFKLAFHDWVMDRFATRRADEIASAEGRILADMRALEHDPAHRRAARMALEDMATDELAQRMLLFSKIPNVIERASKLYVVKDVMGS